MKPMSFTVKVVLSCVGVLLVSVAAWLAIVVPTLMEPSEPEPEVVLILTPEQIAKAKQLRAEQEEEPATWQTDHCDLFRR